jgi:hypothetical protein
VESRLGGRPEEIATAAAEAQAALVTAEEQVRNLRALADVCNSFSCVMVYMLIHVIASKDVSSRSARTMAQVSEVHLRKSESTVHIPT